MKKAAFVLLAVLLAAALPVSALAAQTDVAAMIDALPTVEHFKAMDNAGQVDAYNHTQEAYDAYMALSLEEKEAIKGAEEKFDALFSHYNTLIAPAEGGKTGSNAPVWILLAALLLLVVLPLVKKKAR